MARGWESKSVEAQIDSAQAFSAAAPTPASNPAQIELMRKRESLRLSRIRVLHDLDSAQNPRYRQLLTKALADLEAEIAALGS